MTTAMMPHTWPATVMPRPSRSMAPRSMRGRSVLAIDMAMPPMIQPTNGMQDRRKPVRPRARMTPPRWGIGSA